MMYYQMRRQRMSQLLFESITAFIGHSHRPETLDLPPLVAPGESAWLALPFVSLV